MRVHDVSVALRNDLPHWPGDIPPARRLTSDQAAGDSVTVSQIELSAHAGTHVDAPRHFVPGGAGVEALDLDVLAGPALVVDLTHVHGAITSADLEGTGASRAERLLAKTTNSGWSRSDTDFRKDFIAFDTSAAQWCVDHSIRLLGIDYLSIEPFGSEARGNPVHHTLLEAEVIVLEGLDLDAVAPAPYFLVSLPLPLPEGDGAPSRTVLIEGLI